MDTKTRAERSFDQAQPDLERLSQWMYDNPELGYKEFETSREMAEMLSVGGFEVEYPAYGLETAFAARAGSSGPEVIICAEMDALPEVGQAGGHNIIATAGIGAGLALIDLVDELGIRLTVLGTPAEEHTGGKVDLINAGAFQDAAASMMIHPAVKNVVDPQFLAIAHIEVSFYGKPSHASAEPALGINALDAAVLAYMNIASLRQQILDSDRIHGINWARWLEFCRTGDFEPARHRSDLTLPRPGFGPCRCHRAVSPGSGRRRRSEKRNSADLRGWRE